MSVKHIRICDRCGKEYLLETRVWGWVEFGKFVARKKDGIEIIYQEDELDLCESCMEKFNRFMNMEID